MEQFTVGTVVLVSFPFSNLKGKKIRPALVLAEVEFDNIILCQITSKPYSSRSALPLREVDFKEGGLPVNSFVRPDKLFTADPSIITRKAGVLKKASISTVLYQVKNLFDVPGS